MRMKARDSQFTVNGRGPLVVMLKRFFRISVLIVFTASYNM